MGRERRKGGGDMKNNLDVEKVRVKYVIVLNYYKNQGRIDYRNEALQFLAGFYGTSVQELRDIIFN